MAVECVEEANLFLICTEELYPLAAAWHLGRWLGMKRL